MPGQTSVYLDLFEHIFSVLLRIYIGVELLGHLIILCLIFSGTTKLFSKRAEPFYIPTSNVEGSRWFTALPTFVISVFFFFFNLYYSHPNGYEVVLHCGFDLCFLNDGIFLYACWPFVYLHGRNEKCWFKPFTHLLTGLFCCFHCLAGILIFEPCTPAISWCKSSTQSSLKCGVWAGRRESKEPRRGGKGVWLKGCWYTALFSSMICKSDNSEEEVIALVWHLDGDPFLESVTSTLFSLLL